MDNTHFAFDESFTEEDDNEDTYISIKNVLDLISVAILILLLVKVKIIMKVLGREKSVLMSNMI